MAFPKAIDNAKENSARRVVKQGLFHICGMCGSRYGNGAQAEACLKKCIDRYMAQETVQNKADKSGTVYRCAYCKRVYEKMIQAKECAKTCKSDIQKKIEAEARYRNPQSVADKMKNLAAFAGGEHHVPVAKTKSPAEAPTPSKVSERSQVAETSSPAPDRRSSAAFPIVNIEADAPSAAAKPVHPAEGTKFDREGHYYKCHTCHQKYKKYQEAMACFDLHREQEKAGVSKKKESDDRFFRDGAKYVCKKCNNKYFSRSEVTACYDGHKEEEEPMITGSGPIGKAKTETPAPAAKDGAETARGRRAAVRSDAEKFFRDGAKYVCRVCNKKSFTKSEVIQCHDAHAAAESNPATSDQASDSGPTLTAKDIESAAAAGKTTREVKNGRNRDGQEKFFRDGAKYACKKCNTKHFTRNEVIECFDKH